MLIMPTNSAAVNSINVNSTNVNPINVNTGNAASPRTLRGPSRPASFPPAEFLPSDPRVAEVLENGGLSFVQVDRNGRDIYLYQRLSRDGQPLKDEEAKRPPRYKITAVGLLVCFCTCQSYRTSHEPCKHIRALTWELTGQARAAEKARTLEKARTGGMGEVSCG